MSVKAYGKSKVLSIRESHRRHKEENSEKIVELEEEKDKLKFVLELSGVGVSIVDPMPQELMYLRISDIKLAYINSNIQQTVELKIGGFQLDNDLYLTPFPVVMSSPPVPDKPFFHVSLVRDMKYSDFFCFRYFAVAMQKLSVEVDQAFLVKTVSWSTFITNHMAKRSRGTVERNLLAGTDETIPSITADELSSPDAFYFDIFHINPMEIDISFSPSRNFDATNLEPGAAELLVKLGPYLTPVSEAPITLGGMLVENAFSSRPEFIQNVTTHYTRQFISQAFKLLGSFDFLGNPVSMISGLGSGVYTFVHEPAKAIVESPGDFGISVAKGTGALLKGTLGGALNMAGKLVNNVAKVGEMLTMDDEYRRQREITKAKKARHAGEGFAMGVKEFGSGLFHGVTGLISQPIKGAKKEGLKGLGKGLGKGLLGFVWLSMENNSSST
jgi:vacuolar protein sorting-associated protein 13A/C